MRSNIIVFIGLGLALAACKPAEKVESPAVTIENAWVRLPAVRGRPGAAYFTLRSHRGTYTLEGIQSARVARIELHDSSMMDGSMRMAPLAPPQLDKGKALTFLPNGKHAMLFDVDPKLKAGDTLRLDFLLSGGTRVGVDVPVVAAGDDAPNMHAH